MIITTKTIRKINKKSKHRIIENERSNNNQTQARQQNSFQNKNWVKVQRKIRVYLRQNSKWNVKLGYIDDGKSTECSLKGGKKTN